MDPRFDIHNSHLAGSRTFERTDPHLRTLKQQKYVYHAPLIEELNTEIPGIYTVGGGRQIGKTTMLKQWMLKLINMGVKPESIAFLSGEPIDDQNSLIQILTDQLNQMPEKALRYILIDEVTYISNWAKGIKYLADSGLFGDAVVVLSGSDAVQLREEAIIYLAGRRGKADIVDFHMYSLSFKEYLMLTKQYPDDDILKQKEVSSIMPLLYAAFDQYLIHGGFLTAINEYAGKGLISNSTLMTYAHWIRGDMLKRGKLEHYLRDVIGAIIKRYTKQISWNALAKDMTIDHPSTVADYVALLSAMDAVFVQSALLEDKLTAAPKKAKKLMFTDPFIYHAMNAWISSSNDPFNETIRPAIEDSVCSSDLVEAIVATQYRRYFPTYYIKADGEVDVAYIDEKRFWPVEVKWRNQLRSKDLKQITKYNNATILAKTNEKSDIMGVQAVPLPLALLLIDQGAKCDWYDQSD